MIVLLSSWVEKKTHWRLSWACYFYVFFMTILAVTNTLFLLFNFTELNFAPSDTTTLLLTFVGFLFAFAGINIYSIFNTNIETEKKQLNQLISEYETKLNRFKKEQVHARALMKYQLIGQIVSEQKTIDYQYSENIATLNRMHSEFKSDIEYFRAQYTTSEFNTFKQDLMDITRGVNTRMKQFLNEINSNQKAKFFPNNYPETDKAYTLELVNTFILSQNEFILGEVFEEHAAVCTPQQQDKKKMNWFKRVLATYRYYKSLSKNEV